MTEIPDPAMGDVQISSEENDDTPVTPPDQQPRVPEDDPTQEETIDQRILQEEPDPDSAYGAPENESGLDGPPPVGGDDPDAIPAEQDHLGGLVEEVPDTENFDGTAEPLG